MVDRGRRVGRAVVAVVVITMAIAAVAVAITVAIAMAAVVVVSVGGGGGMEGMQGRGGVVVLDSVTAAATETEAGAHSDRSEIEGGYLDLDLGIVRVHGDLYEEGMKEEKDKKNKKKGPEKRQRR